jgi:hypothetical protein
LTALAEEWRKMTARPHNSNGTRSVPPAARVRRSVDRVLEELDKPGERAPMTVVLTDRARLVADITMAAAAIIIFTLGFLAGANLR